ncbi:Ceramide synthase 1 [Schistosoma japonicum]|nr:Ceramide synthase 1 [Schistosoma japonicum]KAH8849978.1 Ceramide synthase 1 [Schistosoma japonicum]KAH8849979.1 Ceramide synthase 1 [Schistosoma japonicum]
MFQSVKYIYFLLFIFYSTTYCQSTIFDPETGKHYPISDASRIEDIPFILPDPDPKLYPPEFLNSLLKHCDDPMPGYIEMFSKAWIAFKEMGFNWSNYPSSLFFFLRIISAIRPIQVFHAILTGSALTTLRIYITRRFFVKLISDVGVTPETANKLVESCWKGFWFLIMWLFSLKVVILSGRTDFQYPLRAFRDIKFEVGFFDIPTPPDYYWLYTLQLGFYLHSLWSVFFMDAWRKDSSVLVLHHCLSLILLESSLLLRLHRMGVLVLFLHDICDVFLEVGKVNVYLRIRHGKTYPIHMTIANMFFVLFTISWVFLRLYLYPLKVLHATSWGVYISLVGRESRGFLFFNSMLWGLFLMHIYWFMFIIRMAIRLLTSPLEACEDIREDKDSTKNIDDINSHNHKISSETVLTNYHINSTDADVIDTSSILKRIKRIDNNNNNGKSLTNGTTCI